MKFWANIRFYLRPLFRELKHPSNYMLAGLVGLAVNLIQWGGVYASAGPFLLTFLLLTITKATTGYKNSQFKILLELPAKRLDPAFVMDRNGKITLSAGHTQSTFNENEIHTLFDLFDENDAKEIIAAGLENLSDQQLSFYSTFARKWYRVRIKALPPERYMLVWLEDITDQKMADLSLSVIRGFSDEIINSINHLVKNNDSYERLCRLIFKEGYEGVFITREDSGGDLSGACMQNRR